MGNVEQALARAEDVLQEIEAKRGPSAERQGVADSAWRIVRTADPVRAVEQLSLRRTEAEIVAVRVGHGKLAQAPCLIDWSGMNRRLGAPRRIQAPRAKRRVTLVDVVNKNAVDGPEHAVPRMT